MNPTMLDLRVPSVLVLLMLGACAGGTADTADTAEVDERWVDADGDGYVADQDCDDQDPASFPGGTEYCDGADNDCDGVVDDNAMDTMAWYADNDGDGYGNALDHQLSCRQPSGRVSDARDCDDNDASIHPDASESADGIDNDCDGAIDESGDDGGSDGTGTDGQLPGSYGEIDPSSAVDWWVGDQSGASAGSAVIGGYDYTGDGHDDLLLAAPGSNTGGAFYLVPGEHLGLYSGLSLDQASSSGAIGFSSPGSGDRLGSHLALFPDVDGDRVVDFAAGAPGRDNGASDTGTICLYMSSAEAYYYVNTSAQDAALGPVAYGGDTDSDGLSDILVGAPGMSTTQPGQGFAELLLGDRSDMVELGAYWLGDSPYDAVGSSLGRAGDLDGDGFDDVVIAGTGYPAGGDQGAAWIVMGQSRWDGGQHELSDADHQLVGADRGDLAGYAIAGGEDFDADGYDDLVVGDPGAGSGAGAVYLWSGDYSWGDWGRHGSIEAADGVLQGEAARDGAGYSLDLLEDFDGDGAADLLVGAPYHSDNASLQGAAYLLLGSSAWTGSHSLGSATAIWRGNTSGDELGSSVSTAGDVDADGLTDLVIGAPGADEGGSSSGTIFLFLGF
jgi:hypothetical protein